MMAFRSQLFPLSALFIVLLITAALHAEEWWPYGEANEQSMVPATLDTTPLKPEIKAQTSLAPIIKKATPAVVHVFSKQMGNAQLGDAHQNVPEFFRYYFEHFGKRPMPIENLGSGVIITADGYILTNNHVVEGADEVKVALPNFKRKFDARIVGTDPNSEVAVLKIEADGLPTLPLGNSDTMEVGDMVIAIGNPFNVGQTVTKGIVSALSRGLSPDPERFEDYIQTDASINPGNSGGALIDAQGRLVGINTMIITRSGGDQGIGFAIPINLARSIMERMLKYGRVIRGFLGVHIKDIDPDFMDAFNLATMEGVLVDDVVADGAAEEAGIRHGDVIIEFDGAAVRDSRHLKLIVARTPPGTDSLVKLLRDGEELEIIASLKERSDGAGYGTTDPVSNREDGILRGVTLDDLKTAHRERFEIPENVNGVVILSVKPGSAAAAVGLEAGDVIQEIGRRPVASAAEAQAISRDLDEGIILLYVWRKGSGSFYRITNAIKKEKKP